MVSPKEKAIQHTINKMSIEKLLDLWEETEKQVISIELAMVREWIMTALEAKIQMHLIVGWMQSTQHQKAICLEHIL